MTEEHLKLVVELENRINKLMEMVDSTNARLQHAEADYQTKNTELMYAHRKILELQEKYDNLKIAKSISLSKEEIKEGKQRLSKMMREIDNCVSLLND